MDYGHKGMFTVYSEVIIFQEMFAELLKDSPKKGVSGELFPLLSSAFQPLSLGLVSSASLPPPPPVMPPRHDTTTTACRKNFQVVPDVLNTRDNNVSFPLYNKQIHSLCELLMWPSIKLSFSPCAAGEVGGMSLGA